MSEAKDRGGCHPDCGKTQREHALSEHASMEPGWAMDAASERVYCTVACRDARPIPAPEPAKPQHPERRAGQRWRYVHGDLRDEVIVLTTRHEGDYGWNAKLASGKEGWFTDANFEHDGGEYSLTLIADAPAPEATKAELFGCPYCPMTFANVEQRDAHAHPPRGPHLCANPLPAGKVEAAKAMPKCDRGCSASAAVRFVKNFGTGYVERRRLCDMCYLRTEPDRAIPSTSVLRADTPQLIDRRRSYQPMDDSFAEDC